MTTRDDISEVGAGSGGPHPGRPTAAASFALGVTGHRDLPLAQPGSLARVVATLLDEIRRAAATDARRPVACRVVSSLAAGADTIAAEVAVLGRHELHCPLPFHRERYADDFQDEADRERFWDLLGRADAVYEIDGDRGDPRSYLAAGRLVLDHSDVLLAVWDGRPERGVGGTAQVVREARSAGLPVIVVEPGMPHGCRMLDGDSADPATVARRAVAAAFRDAAGGGPGGGHEADEDAGEPPGATARRRGSPRIPPEAPSRTEDGAAQPALAWIDRHFAPELARADAVAVRQARACRLAATLRYAAMPPAAVATLVALQGSPALSRLGFAAQLAILVSLLGLSWLDGRLGWHRRALDHRALAEHLRHARVLALLGNARVSPRTAWMLRNRMPWVTRRVRDAARAVGLVSARVDGSYLRGVVAALAEDCDAQRAFYRARASRFRLRADRLKALGLSLWALGVGCVVLRLAFGLGRVAGPLSVSVVDLAVLVPALASAVFGFRAQNQYDELARRYGALAEELGRIREDLPRHGGSRAALEPVALDAVGLMLTEVCEWRTLMKAHDLSPF